ncbi:hypothetical protein ACP70R_006369 [Stipagrostis hirtigluma subsp. patula]
MPSPRAAGVLRLRWERHPRLGSGGRGGGRRRGSPGTTPFTPPRAIPLCAHRGKQGTASAHAWGELQHV